MTPSQILDVVAIALSLVSLAIAMYRRPQSKRRPRVIVTISQTAVTVDARKAFYADMLKDRDRDYVIVAAQTEQPINVLEIM